MAKVTPTKSRTPFYGLIAIFAVAGAAFIWYAMSSSVTKPITLDSTLATDLPPAEGYLLGDPNAPVTIVEFGDFECPLCGRFASMEEPDIRSRLVQTGMANFRFLDFPIPEIHPNTLAASLAASCAADQGKFWEMHDEIFNRQDEWSGVVTSTPKKYLDSYAAKVGLDITTYNECFASQKNLARIQAHKQAGMARSVTGTPSFVIGDKVYPGIMRFDDIKHVVDSIIATMPAKTITPDSAGH